MHGELALFPTTGTAEKVHMRERADVGVALDGHNCLHIARLSNLSGRVNNYFPRASAEFPVLLHGEFLFEGFDQAATPTQRNRVRIFAFHCHAGSLNQNGRLAQEAERSRSPPRLQTSAVPQGAAQ